MHPLGFASPRASSCAIASGQAALLLCRSADVLTISRQLLKDDAGFIVSAELVMLGSVLVLGLVVGVTGVQDSVVGEYGEMAGALRSMNQSYSYTGMQGCWSPRHGYSAWTAGSAYLAAGQAAPVCFGLCPPAIVGECVDCPPPAESVPPLPCGPCDELPCAPPACIPLPDVTCPPVIDCPPVCPPITPGTCVDCPPGPYLIPAPVVRPCTCELGSDECPELPAHAWRTDWSLDALPPTPLVW
jgi:hypothetical protein